MTCGIRYLCYKFSSPQALLCILPFSSFLSPLTRFLPLSDSYYQNGQNPENEIFNRSCSGKISLSGKASTAQNAGHHQRGRGLCLDHFIFSGQIFRSGEISWRLSCCLINNGLSVLVTISTIQGNKVQSMFFQLQCATSLDYSSLG